MRARNAWIFGGIAVLASIALVFVRPGSEPPDTRPAPDRSDPPLDRIDQVESSDPGTREVVRDIPPIRKRFEAEVREEGWASVAEQDLRDALAVALPDGVTAEVACRTSACEATFTADDLGGALDAIGAQDSYPAGVTSVVLGAIEPGPPQRIRVLVEVER